MVGRPCLLLVCTVLVADLEPAGWIEWPVAFHRIVGFVLPRYEAGPMLWCVHAVVCLLKVGL